MEKEQREAKKKPEESLEELQMENSPYLNYGDLEDYKQKAYGTKGHLEPKVGRGAGGTEAPTLSGCDASRQCDVPAAEVAATCAAAAKESPR